MIIRSMTLTGACAMLTVVAACGGSGSGNSDGGSSTNSNSSSNSSQPANCKVYTACNVLTAADVTSATSASFPDGGMEIDIGAGTAVEGADCNYASATTKVLFHLSCGVGVPAAQFPGIEADAGHTATAVSGLGDAAFSVDDQELVVYLGSNIQFTLRVLTSGDAGTFVAPADAVTTEKALATKILTRLP